MHPQKTLNYPYRKRWVWFIQMSWAGLHPNRVHVMMICDVSLCGCVMWVHFRGNVTQLVYSLQMSSQIQPKPIPGARSCPRVRAQMQKSSLCQFRPAGVGLALHSSHPLGRLFRILVSPLSGMRLISLLQSKSSGVVVGPVSLVQHVFLQTLGSCPFWQRVMPLVLTLQRRLHLAMSFIHELVHRTPWTLCIGTRLGRLIGWPVSKKMHTKKNNAQISSPGSKRERKQHNLLPDASSNATKMDSTCANFMSLMMFGNVMYR